MEQLVTFCAINIFEYLKLFNFRALQCTNLCIFTLLLYMAEEILETKALLSEDLYEEVRLRIDAGQEPLRIDKFLTDRLAGISRNRIQQGIRAGSILVDNEQIKPNFKIKPHQEILLVLPKPAYDGQLIPENIPLDIRYEDEELLIVHKPPGMVVHPGFGNYSGTLVNALAYHFENLPKGNSDVSRPGLVHRIDKDTSGLLVIAKTEYAMSFLAKQFYEHTVNRLYMALVWGDVAQDNGTITGNIDRHPRDRKKYAITQEPDKGKHAITHYQVIKRLGYVTLVAFKLETGRTHQIRVHISAMGHPIFNDKDYGGDQILRGKLNGSYKKFVDNCFLTMPRMALHAQTLGFLHPTKKERLDFEAVLPDDFSALLQRWERYVTSNEWVEEL